MSIPTPLVNLTKATEFVASMSLPTPRMAVLGDPQKLHSEAYNAIREADRALVEGVTSIQRLPKDETRTEVSKHGVAKQLADRTVAVLESSQRTIERVAAKLSDEATALIDGAFYLPPGRAVMHSDMAAWINRNRDTVEGSAKIDEAVRTNIEFAAVVYHTPHQLLGMSQDSKNNLWGKAAKQHIPKAVGLLIQSDELSAIAANYPQVARSVAASFYNSALAERVKNRVEA